jgi:hypothetical protein
VLLRSVSLLMLASVLIRSVTLKTVLAPCSSVSSVLLLSTSLLMLASFVDTISDAIDGAGASLSTDGGSDRLS